jgi:hypothetical protein
MSYYSLIWSIKTASLIRRRDHIAFLEGLGLGLGLGLGAGSAVTAAAAALRPGPADLAICERFAE